MANELSTLVNGIQSRAEKYRLERGNALDLSEALVRDTSHPKDLEKPFSYAGHEYQVDLINCMHKFQAIQKCSQIGITEIMIRKFIKLLMRIGGVTLLYTMPTQMVLNKFSKTRLGPILAGCKLQSTKDMGHFGRATRESLTIIPIPGNSWFLFGATKSRMSSISDPVDFLVHDETDESNLANIGNCQSRTKHSRWGNTTWLSNPKMPGYGVCEKFNVSDQRHYQIRCPHCGTMQKTLWTPEEFWKDTDGLPFICRRRELNGNPKLDAVEAEGYVYACTNPACRRELSYQMVGPKNMEWIADYTELPRMIEGEVYNWVGWHMNQIIGWNWLKAQDIVDGFSDILKTGGEEAYINAFGMMLGLPFDRGFQKIKEEDIRACERADIKWKSSAEGGTIICWDQGLAEHYIAVLEPHFTTEGVANLKVLHAEAWKENIFDVTKEGRIVSGRVPILADRYKCAIGIGDAQGNNAEGAEALCKSSYGRFWRVYYPPHGMMITMKAEAVNADKPDYVIKADREKGLDRLFFQYVRGGRFWIPPLHDAPGDAGRMILRHLTNMTRMVKDGQAKWYSNGPDHMSHVFSYGVMGLELLNAEAFGQLSEPDVWSMGK